MPPKESISHKKIKRILVANRGEIALRIMRTAKRLGIKTVAIHSDIDTGAPFVSMADEAISLGGTSSRENYLDIEKILNAIELSHADAVHPGYGFLSENSSFVKILENKGVTFIGPASSSMEDLGDKVKAKILATNAGVSVVPGFVGIIENEEKLIKIADDIGFPVIIKAVAGGGGKGMKIVYCPADLSAAAESAKNEARNSFGDDRIFIERYIQNPRHIEIQIIGDKHNNIVCLGERECSIQRFNQKIIEESPSSFIDETTRRMMYEHAIKLTKASNYYSAGTVEFIVDQDKNFYFLEMNTRLQVEHTVTEYVTNLDLVELMIRVAEGEHLPFSQDTITLNGWSIETRICAEDPSKNFLPSVGRITNYIEPIRRYGSRVDSGVVQGSEISPYYDSMIAKLITYGDSRTEAIQEMKRSLSEFVIDGVSTNISLLEAIMRHDKFISGEISTNFVKDEYPNGFKGLEIDSDITRAFVATAIVVHMAYNNKLYSGSDLRKDMAIDSVQDVDINKLSVVIGAKNRYDINIVSYSDRSITIAGAGRKFVFTHDYVLGHKVIRGTINSTQIAVKVKQIDGGYNLSFGGVTERVGVYRRHVADLLKYVPYNKSSIISDRLISPLSGVIVRICVTEGQSVLEGQELVVIEAMKMENVIRAEFETKIGKIIKNTKDIVSVGETVMHFDKVSL